MRVFRRLNYGFAQARNRSPDPGILLRFRYPEHVQHLDLCRSSFKLHVKGKRVWFKVVVGMHIYPRHL
jgi:hypothetical protein